jgi:hypothetical protein
MAVVTESHDDAPRVNTLVGHDVEETESINSLLSRGVIVVVAGSTERLASWMARPGDPNIEPLQAPMTEEPIASSAGSLTILFPPLATRC